MGLFGALVVEKVLDDVVSDGEERATGGVGRGVLAIGARDAPGEGSCPTETSVRPQCAVNDHRPTASTLYCGDDGDEGEQSLECHGGRPSG